MPAYPALQPGQKLTVTRTEVWECTGPGGPVTPDVPPVTPPAVTLPRLIVFPDPGSGSQTDEMKNYQCPDLRGLIGGRPLFPPSPATAATRGQALWNLPVDTIPAARPESAGWLGTIAAVGNGPGRGVGKLWPDFSTSAFGAGMPVNVVPGNQPHVPVTITLYPQESDVSPSGYPIPDPCFVESPGDSHALILDKDNLTLWEFGVLRNESGILKADVVAKWDLTRDAARTPGWTSADAAGCCVTVGLVTYPEVAAAIAANTFVSHALRFTAQPLQRGAIAPASHLAGATPAGPPLGARLRLKPSVDVTKLPGTSTATLPQARAILLTVKKFGLILADTGGSGYVSGAPDKRWNDGDLGQLKSFPLTPDLFEFVDTGHLIQNQF